MKQYRRIIIVFFLLFLVCVIGVDLYYLKSSSVKQERNYEVEINRLSQLLKAGQSIDDMLTDCKYITAVTSKQSEDTTQFFYGDNCEYVIRDINGTLYRFDYKDSYQEKLFDILILFHLLIVGLAVMAGIVFAYIRKKILVPFQQIQGLPYELSKGNLNIGLKESKSRYFGRFLWGLDLLRQHLESEKRKELSLQKEKKTLILSLSHDIKTPLSAIKLYSQALSKQLYSDPQKQQELYSLISVKADEIENYVTQIMQASKEDFLHIDVAEGEFYLRQVVESISAYYQDKLGLLKTEFQISSYHNCLLCGDYDRAVEVIQNLMENAIKYGDQQSIKINLTREEEYQLITVINSGCTLSESEVPHIFESFWRGSNVKDQPGSGLGLYICRQIMQKSRGDIFASCKDGVMQVSAVFRMS